jgi:hypothetical protein
VWNLYIAVFFLLTNFFHFSINNGPKISTKDFLENKMTYILQISKKKFKQGVCHSVALPFALKSILRQKKNYEYSNISAYKNTIFKKSSKRNQNPSRCYNSITNLNFQHKPKYIIFQKSSYQNRLIT